IIAAAQVKAGKIKQALETVKGIEDAGFRIYALTIIAAAQVKAGKIKQALETVKGIEDAGFRIYALTVIAEAMIEVKNKSSSP
ncbi:MAG: hypothetical protein JKY46_10405, partial [Robiginitomaculum sp.]|nr:hypothetical protein [Robiginitomaculum sp.]